MTGDRVDQMTREEREARVEILYGLKPIPPTQLMDLVSQAVAQQQGLSLVRSGDVMATLLSGRPSSIGIWSFIGVSYPPPQEFLTQLLGALRGADIVGLTHRSPYAGRLAGFMTREAIVPPYVVESFVNDALLAEGHLHDLIRQYLVVLVGRSASAAAGQLSAAGLTVAGHVSLGDWSELPRVSQQLLASAHTWDVALIGAGESGRILATHLARHAQKVALDIGHAMDGIAHPEIWQSDRRRQIYRQMYQRPRK